MTFEVWADPGFERELEALPREARSSILAALPGLRDHPLEHPQLVRLKGSAFPGSFRLRVGRHRVLGLVLPAQSLILLTTLFLKRRDADYAAAVGRHAGRLTRQGPLLGEFILRSRRK